MRSSIGFSSINLKYGSRIPRKDVIQIIPPIIKYIGLMPYNSLIIPPINNPSKTAPRTINIRTDTTFPISRLGTACCNKVILCMPKIAIMTPPIISVKIASQILWLKPRAMKVNPPMNKAPSIMSLLLFILIKPINNEPITYPKGNPAKNKP